MSEQYNLILAIILSLVILLTFNYFYYPPTTNQPSPTPEHQTSPQETPIPRSPDTSSDTTASSAVVQDRHTLLTQQYAAHQRIDIATQRLQGSVLLLGARFDDLTLLDYSVTTHPQSSKIVLLAPSQTVSSTRARFGWSSTQTDISLPDAKSLWRIKGPHQSLTPTTPLVLEWDNGAGLIFEIDIALDENYLFTVTQRVHNSLDRSISLSPYGLITRAGTPEGHGFYILHEGPIGVFDGTLHEYDYSDLQEEGRIQQRSRGGWIGITDKYWLISLIPDQQESVTTRFIHTMSQQLRRYQVDLLGSDITIAPGDKQESTIHLFAGAKEVRLLDSYAAQYQIANFDLAVDFGWFYFLTKPFFYILDILNRFCGNLGLTILLMTFIIKLLFYPLASRSYRAISKMKMLQPEMLKLRERFAQDHKRMQQELMALYKREKVNPLSGCLPILLQIPVFFALYKVLLVTIEMRHAPFFGWIHDLSAPDPTTLFNLFGLLAWEPPTFLLIGVWPLIMGGTMFLQQRLNPMPLDPVQARIFMFLPLVFTLILARFPVGLIIYWTCNNVLSIGQQWLIMRQAKKVTPT